MSWSLYRWVWQLEAPLFTGMPPAGSLNRCRLYVPARAIWGAVTAELAQRQANGFPEYQRVGGDVREKARFTYLYPAERANGSWLAWLPHSAESNGLSWRREGKAGDADARIPDRQFRRRLLDARPGTAIDPDSDSAAEGSLRETECMMQRWRQDEASAGSPVALVGYVFARHTLSNDLQSLDALFLGGDTRYGFGRVRRISWHSAGDLFGRRVAPNGPDPTVSSEIVFGHAWMNGDKASLRGALEQVSGWDRAGNNGLKELESASLWVPGSTAGDANHPALWRITPDGLWELAETPAG